jgi:hypothetical protein
MVCGKNAAKTAPASGRYRSRLRGTAQRRVRIVPTRNGRAGRRLAQGAPLADEPYPVDLARDLRGWFYRALASDAGCAVLEVGDAHLGNWFTDVTRANLRQVDGSASHRGRFDVVVVHQSLGGCENLQSALLMAARMLRQGGWLVMFGANRLRPAPGGLAPTAGMPSATGWGYRSAFARAGFGDISLYIAHPPDVAPVYLIDAHRRSARAFFSAELIARNLPVWSPRRWAMAILVATNLMSYLQPGFVVVGRKC